MSQLRTDAAVLLFLVILGLFFGNLWAVKSDQQAEAEHQKIMQWKMENKGERHAN